MKSLILMAIYIASYIIIYLMLCCVGWIFTDISFPNIVHSSNWTMMYTLLIGWWAALLPAREYYVHYKSYFHDIF
jgi:hypothetical protein